MTLPIQRSWLVLLVMGQAFSKFWRDFEKAGNYSKVYILVSLNILIKILYSFDVETALRQALYPTGSGNVC